MCMCNTIVQKHFMYNRWFYSMLEVVEKMNEQATCNAPVYTHIYFLSNYTKVFFKFKMPTTLLDYNLINRLHTKNNIQSYKYIRIIRATIRLTCLTDN